MHCKCVGYIYSLVDVLGQSASAMQTKCMEKIYIRI